MVSPLDPALSPVIRFPGFADFTDLNALSIVIQDLSLIYDVSAIAVLPEYGHVEMPDSRFGPRRWSPLGEGDRIKVARISLASPLVMVFNVAELAATVSGIMVVANRVLVAAKTWQDILAAGTDIKQREQAIAENRKMAPARLREVKLNNELLEQQVRRARAEADVVEAARDEILKLQSSVRKESSGNEVETARHTAASLNNADFAYLLDEPIQRLLEHSGGEIEISSGNHMA
jgi:hypothetical protein